MSNTTFTSTGQTYNMTINPAAPMTSGKKYPVIFLIHGNAGLVTPFGDQIHDFAKDLAGLGYLTVVPEYYNTKHPPNLGDTSPHDLTLADAISVINSTRNDADLERLGLIGFSLGATTAMTYIASKPPGTVKVVADFFGFITPAIKQEVAKFPPTIILHNKDDKIVDISYSNELNTLLENAKIEHQFEVYEEEWHVNYHGLLVEVDHSFKPGNPADVNSRAKVTNWFVNYLPPSGK